MTEPPTKAQFIALLQPITAALGGIELDGPGAAAAVARAVPFDGPLVDSVRAAAFAAVESDWLLPKEQGGIRFGRVAKDLDGFSVDCVLMDRPGPRHRHPNGEIDLCFARSGQPRFDGQPEGWVAYGQGSVHVPTVRGGEMLILYFLPGGAIEFLGS
jgi:hypothetical protein